MDDGSISYYKVLEKINSVSHKKKKFSIYFLTNFNHSVLLNYLKYHLIKENLEYNIFSSKYDQVDQEIINLKKNKKLIKSDILIIFLDFEKYYSLFPIWIIISHTKRKKNLVSY